MKTRVCLVLDKERKVTKVVSDYPVSVYCIDDSTESDRVFELSDGVVVDDVKEVNDLIGNQPIGHIHDSSEHGTGYGPKKESPKTCLKLVK